MTKNQNITKDYDIVGLTNVMTDVIINVTDEELNRLGLTLSLHNNYSDLKDKETLDRLLKREHKVSHGGSPGNVIYSASYWGMKCAMFGTIGTDEYGQKYQEVMESRDIDTYFSQKEGNSGIVIVLVDPKGEKTFIEKEGVYSQFDVNFDDISRMGIFHTSGYELMGNPQATLDSIKAAKANGAKISFDMADPMVIKKNKKHIDEIVKICDILFMTEAEAEEFKGKTYEEAWYLMRDSIEFNVLKKGEKGSAMKHYGTKIDIPRYPTTLVNTNGAGDTYAAGFLIGVTNKLPPEEIGRFASYYASRIVSREEAHF